MEPSEISKFVEEQEKTELATNGEISEDAVGESNRSLCSTEMAVDDYFKYRLFSVSVSF